MDDDLDAANVADLEVPGPLFWLLLHGFCYPHKLVSGKHHPYGPALAHQLISQTDESAPKIFDGNFYTFTERGNNYILHGLEKIRSLPIEEVYQHAREEHCEFRFTPKPILHACFLLKILTPNTDNTSNIDIELRHLGYLEKILACPELSYMRVTERGHELLYWIGKYFPTLMSRYLVSYRPYFEPFAKYIAKENYPILLAKTDPDKVHWVSEVLAGVM